MVQREYKEHQTTDKGLGIIHERNNLLMKIKFLTQDEARKIQGQDTCVFVDRKNKGLHHGWISTDANDNVYINCHCCDYDSYPWNFDKICMVVLDEDLIKHLKQQVID